LNSVMADNNQKRDEVLRRMLATKPTPHDSQSPRKRLDSEHTKDRKRTDRKPIDDAAR
jgi:hypothetical protein